MCALTHAHTRTHNHKRTFADTLTLTDKQILCIRACTFLLTQLHKHICLATVGLTAMYKMSESHFLSAFSPFPNDPHKPPSLEEKRRHGPSRLLWLFPQSLRTTMVFLRCYCITPLLPWHCHTTKETNKVLMFNRLNTLIPPAVTKLSQLRAAWTTSIPL